MKECFRCKFLNEEDSSECSNCGSPLNSAGVDNNFGKTFPATQGKTNGYAIASMVLGIVSIPLICCCYIGIIPGILAVIFGFIARNKLIASCGAEKGNGMALAGIITGFVSIGLVILLLVFTFSGGFSSTEFMKEFQKQFEESMKNRQT